MNILFTPTKYYRTDKMYLVNKIFNNETIRTVWDNEQEKCYVSVVDVVGILANSDSPRKYWNWLKNKIKKKNYLSCLVLLDNSN